MKTATMASARTAHAARKSLNSGLQVAFRSGAVMGLVVVGFGLLDICAWFTVLYYLDWFNMGDDLGTITVVMLCFGMGASTQALFARLGGGIFTKAADVGADLVGKVEAGIPEDDPRNPATIADNVGDNVGDVAGMGADLYESYCGSILAASALGVAAGFGKEGVILPMTIAGLGIIFSVLGCYLVRSGEEATQKVLLKALSRGVNASVILILIASALLVYGLLGGHYDTRWHSLGIWGAIVAGLLAGWIIGKATERYTSDNFKPTRGISDQAKTGPATVIIQGLAVGMSSTGVCVVTIALGILLSFAFSGGFSKPELGLFGIGVASVGMLSTLGITLATDAYGPIADNAGGNAEMSNLGPEVRERTDALDALGNTTAATGKGFAIGSAALTALALLAAYIEEIRIGLHRVDPKAVLQVGSESIGVMEATISDFMAYYNVTLMNPKVIIGLFLGGMMVFVFCSRTMKAVGRAAGKMVEEVRRQFKEIAGIMEGTATPDYAACVDISTRAAQKEMIIPSLFAIVIPVATGLLLGVAGVMGLLAGALSCGFVLAITMNNAGGAWDNAKKYIEKGHLGGKGSDAHKAAVVGDTVGDPFKDTSGPSLNILIKLMSMVSVIFAGLIAKFAPVIQDFLHIGGR
jgi:K(+)-stimulated pyrophosphate-energized sodium pump